jgi:hypothetical protein
MKEYEINTNTSTYRIKAISFEVNKEGVLIFYTPFQEKGNILYNEIVACFKEWSSMIKVN